MIKKPVKNGYLKSRNLSEENKPNPSTNIPLLSLQKSEQGCPYHDETLNVPIDF